LSLLGGRSVPFLSQQGEGRMGEGGGEVVRR